MAYHCIIHVYIAQFTPMSSCLLVLQVAEQQSVPRMEQLFQIGSLLPCYVTAVRDNKMVSLSINPRLVNTNLSASDVKADMVGHRNCFAIHKHTHMAHTHIHTWHTPYTLHTHTHT